MKLTHHIEDLPNDVILVGDLAIDTEAMGLKLDRDRLCLVQICDEDNNVHIVQFKSDTTYNSSNLRKILLDRDRQKIFHYARFDVAILRKYLNIDNIPNIYCTYLASKISRTYTAGHSLKSIVNEFIGVDLKKDQQMSNWGSDSLSKAQIEYAANDVIYLHKIRNRFTEMLKINGRYELAEQIFECVNAICYADILGFDGDLFTHG